MTRRPLRWTVLVALPLFVAAAPAAVADATIPVKGFLCDSAAHAILFADAKAGGETDEIAKDRVGRTAKAEVCGRYTGLAMVESEEVKLASGTAYKLTAFRFKKDRRLAWLAERSFAPTTANWDL